MSYRVFVVFPRCFLILFFCFSSILLVWASISLDKLKKLQTLAKIWVFLIQKFQCMRQNIEYESKTLVQRCRSILATTPCDPMIPLMNCTIMQLKYQFDRRKKNLERAGWRKLETVVPQIFWPNLSGEKSY